MLINKQELKTEKYLFTKVLTLVQKFILKSFDSTEKLVRVSSKTKRVFRQKIEKILEHLYYVMS